MSDAIHSIMNYTKVSKSYRFSIIIMFLSFKVITLTFLKINDEHFLFYLKLFFLYKALKWTHNNDMITLKSIGK